MLADWVQDALRQIQRGALQFGGETIVLFGNDNYAGDAEVLCEVECTRQALRAADVPEIAFETSTDGVSWVLVLSMDDPRLQTEIGKRFRMEMVRAILCDVVNGVWQEAAGVPVQASPFA